MNNQNNNNQINGYNPQNGQPKYNNSGVDMNANGINNSNVSNVNHAYNPNVSNVNNINKQNNSTSPSNGLNVASLVIGIISLILMVPFSIFIVPLAIVGLILGIVSKKKSGMKTAGIVLNVFGIVLPTVLFVCLIFLSAVHKTKLDMENQKDEQVEEISNPVAGEWNCALFDGNGKKGQNIVTMNLKGDKTFALNKYLDAVNNHVYGKYTYKVLEKENAPSNAKYYNIVLNGDEFVNDGARKDSIPTIEYEMAIKNDAYNSQAIIMNTSTYKMYYCEK